MILLGEKKEKVHLYGLELLLLALKSDSTQEEQLGRERQLLTLIFNLRLGKDVTHCPMDHSKIWNTSLSIVLFKVMF